MKTYIVADEDGVTSGTAEEILERILQKPLDLAPDLRGLSSDQYADLLIRSASYYLPKNVADSFEEIKFNSKYDFALSLLSAMPASGTHIISSEEASNGPMKEVL